MSACLNYINKQLFQFFSVTGNSLLQNRHGPQRDYRDLINNTPAASSEYPEKIGLIAAQGDFPVLIARSAASLGTQVIAICLNGFASPEVETLAHKTYWLDLGQLNKAIELLHQEGVTHLTMAGRVPHNNIFQYRHFDWRAMKLIARAASKRADALLQTVCDEFAKDGIAVVESSLFLRSLMPTAGLLTPQRPLTSGEESDIKFGIPIARVIAGQDIGQTIVVKDTAVIAVEGMEGTDKCIERAGALAGPGCVVVKVAKPSQDLRFDIPVIGPGTIKHMKESGATALALSSGRSLLFHRNQVIADANEAGISILIFDDHDATNQSLTK